MSNRPFATWVAAVIGFWGMAPAQAQDKGGPDWVEPPGQDTAGRYFQQAKGPDAFGRPLQSLSGRLDGKGLDDYEDLFLIRIPDLSLFAARTEFPKDPPIPPLVNTMLWLFYPDGLGLLANDDRPPPPPMLVPQLLSAFDFRDIPPESVPPPGCFYLAVSRFDNQPFSIGGRIFNLDDPPGRTQISLADGPGADDPFSDWDRVGDPAVFGSYAVYLDGAQWCPEPTSVVLLTLALAGLRRRRPGASRMAGREAARRLGP